jgi:hypothetical protein
MYLDKFGRNWTGPVPFNLAEVTRLAPQLRKAGLYQILYMKMPVYIGVSSVSIFERLRNHASGTGNEMASRRVGAKQYEFVYWFCDGITARQIESHVTVEDKPGFNQKTEYINYIASISVH